MRESAARRRAFERYLRLGDERSIEKLQTALAADGDAPSLRTLYEWSRKLDWQARVDEIEQAATESSSAVLDLPPVFVPLPKLEPERARVVPV